MTDAPPATAPVPKQDSKNIAARWGGHHSLLANGFVGVPVAFLNLFSRLTPHSLTVAEALFVICLMAHKWDKRAPFPGYKRIATRMGVTESYARKLAKNLEAKGFLKRRLRVGTTNEFDLQPLFDRLAQEVASTQTASTLTADTTY